MRNVIKLLDALTGLGFVIVLGLLVWGLFF